MGHRHERNVVGIKHHSGYSTTVFWCGLCGAIGQYSGGKVRWTYPQGAAFMKFK